MIWLFAHQGGWDEILYFLVPGAAAVLLLRWAGQRARAKAQQQEQAEDTTEPGGNPNSG